MDLHYRRCTASDLNELIQISRDTFKAAFEKENNPDDFATYFSFAFSEEKIRSELEHKACHFYFVYDQNTLVAYFKLNEKEAQTDVKDEQSVEVERIYVLEAHQGKNIGSWILEQIQYLGKKMGKNYIWLGVWEHNRAAIRFYQRYGYEKFGTHPYYIGKDKQTDWLLRLEL